MKAALQAQTPDASADADSMICPACGRRTFIPDLIVRMLDLKPVGCNACGEPKKL